MTRATSMLIKVEQYLQFRRSLGYQLRVEGRQLQQFAAFADSEGHSGPLTTDLAVRWARLPADADRLYWARRLEVVRCFARYLAATEPGTELPPRGLLGPAHRRTTPHVYTDTEVTSLIDAARRLSPSGALRPQTYACLIGLLSCTGLRISEALRLTQSDTDLDRGILTIRETKFRKTRLVPLHSTAVTALQDYADARQRLTATPELMARAAARFEALAPASRRKSRTRSIRPYSRKGSQGAVRPPLEDDCGYTAEMAHGN